MGTFIQDGAAVLPPVKADLRPASGAVTEWAAGDANKERQALLDLRAAAISEEAARIAADAAIIASGVTPANVGTAPVTATGSTQPRAVADRFGDYVNVLDFGAMPVNAVPWVWGDVYAPGARVVSQTAPARVYETVLGGWAGNAAPQGTGAWDDKGTASEPGQDGVLWAYVEDVVDSLAAIQAALAAVTAGGNVHLPPGLYFISTGIVTGADKQGLNGDGQENTWLYHPGGGGIALHLKYSQGAAKNLSVFMFTPHADNVGVQSGYDGAEEGYVGGMVIENVGAYASRSFGASLGKGFLCYGLESRITSIKSMLWGRALSFEFMTSGPIAGPDSAPNAWAVSSATLRESTVGCHVAGETIFLGGTMEGCGTGLEDDDSYPANGSSVIKAFGVHFEQGGVNCPSVRLSNPVSHHFLSGCNFSNVTNGYNIILEAGCTCTVVGGIFNKGCTVSGASKMLRVGDVHPPAADFPANTGSIVYMTQFGIKPLLVGDTTTGSPRIMESREFFGPDAPVAAFSALANSTTRKTATLAAASPRLPMQSGATPYWRIISFILVANGSGLQYALPQGIFVTYVHRADDEIDIYLTNITGAPIAIDNFNFSGLAFQV